MAAPESSKRRATRIPLDYFTRPNLWERRKLVMTLLAVLVAAVWWTSGALLGRQAALHAPAPVAAVHQTWNDQCNACHAAFQPVCGDALPTAWQGGTPLADSLCASCHAAPAHQVAEIKTQVPGCASCHHEHRGEDASLVRVADRSCTECHAAIDQHTDPHTLGGRAAREQLANVTRFDKDHHPAFRSARKDPGRIKFSHFQHMMPGVHEHGRDDRQPMRLSDIRDPQQRERYRRPGQEDDNLVQLECGSCHVPDGGDFGLKQVAGMPHSILPARSTGAYMVPITFENQCRACHVLEYEPRNPASTVLHRQSPEELRRTLRQAYAAEYLAGNPKLLEVFIPSAPLPNQPLAPEAEQAAQRIKDKAGTAEQYLSQAVCGKCHYGPPADQPGLQPVAAADLPAVWFTAALFDHRAHRAIDCRVCHAAAYADDAKASKDAKDVLVPQIDVCLKCHAPHKGSTTDPQGGARFDCVECHRYHNGAAPLAGPGAKSECPAQTMNIEQFHRGTSP
jgi:hypothetical protein